MAKKVMQRPAVIWIVLSAAGLMGGILLASGERHWSVVPTGAHPVDQAISPDESLLVVLNAGEDSLSFIDLETKVPFEKLYLPIQPGATPTGNPPLLSSVEFNGDGSRIFVTTTDGQYFVIDPVTSTMLDQGITTPTTLLEGSGFRDGVLGADTAGGTLYLLTDAGAPLPILDANGPVERFAVDVVQNAEIVIAVKRPNAAVAEVYHADAETLAIRPGPALPLPGGSSLGDVRALPNGYDLAVTYAAGGLELTSFDATGVLASESENLSAEPGRTIAHFGPTGIYAAHLDPGAFTLVTQTDTGHETLRLLPGGFEDVPLRGLSVYPEQPDAFAATIGPYEPMLGIPGWEGIVVFDPNGQTVMGFGNNNSGGCESDDDCPADTSCVDHCCVDGDCKSDQLPQPCSVFDFPDPIGGCPGETIEVTYELKNTGACTRTYSWVVNQVTGAPGVSLTLAPATGAETLAANEVVFISVFVSISANSTSGGTGSIRFIAANSAGSTNCGSHTTVGCSNITTVEVLQEVTDHDDLGFRDPIDPDPVRIIVDVDADLEFMPCPGEDIRLEVTLRDTIAEGAGLSATACWNGPGADANPDEFIRDAEGFYVGARFSRIVGQFQRGVIQSGRVRIEGGEGGIPNACDDNVAGPMGNQTVENGRWICIKWTAGTNDDGGTDVVGTVAMQQPRQCSLPRDCDGFNCGCPCPP